MIPEYHISKKENQFIRLFNIITNTKLSESGKGFLLHWAVPVSEMWKPRALNFTLGCLARALEGILKCHPSLFSKVTGELFTAGNDTSLRLKKVTSVSIAGIKVQISR